MARAVFTLPKFDTNTVTTIITQATPHRAPVMSIDSYMVDMYNRVNDYWMSHVNTTLKYVTVLSTGGGFRDFQVPTSLTSLTGVSTYSNTHYEGFVNSLLVCCVACSF